MEIGHHARRRGLWRSGGILFSAIAITAAITSWGVKPAVGEPPQEMPALKQKADIEALAMRYTEAVDAIGRGDVDEGSQLIRTCFTEDTLFESWFPFHDTSTPADHSVVGPDAWIDLNNDAIATGGYTRWQHHIGNIQVDVQGATATMKSYLTAYLILDWSSSVDLVTGVYTDDLIRTPSGWRFVHRRLQTTSILRLSGSSP